MQLKMEREEKHSNLESSHTGCSVCVCMRGFLECARSNIKLFVNPALDSDDGELLILKPQS